MRKPIRSTILIAVLGMAIAAASDLDKEQRWRDQIVDALLDGEAVTLDDGRSGFLAIETESADGGVAKSRIIMQGTGVHPDWPTVELPLRIGLTDSCWHTLPIQMPVLANEAEHADYAAIYDWVPGRIDAAVRYLRDNGAATVVLVAHSQGATMAVYHVSRRHAPVDGLVAVGMSGGVAGGPMDTLAQLPGIDVPQLDLFGSEDLDEVLASRAARADAARGGSGYRQLEIAGADHFFDGEETPRLEAVNGWLDARF